MNAPVSNDIALRIGLAARELPETTPAVLLNVLEDIIGLPPTPAKLKKVSVKHLKTACDGKLAEFSMAELKEAAAYLRGEKNIDFDDGDLPKPVAYVEGDMPESIRVALSSNSGESLDGHFGSCTRFLIYQVSASEIRLIDVRTGTTDSDDTEDKMAARADAVKDCQLLYVVSIGGPAAAKVVRRNVHPIKRPTGGEASQLLADLQESLKGSPAPWLAKVMGQNAEERVRFELEEADA